ADGERRRAVARLRRADQWVRLDRHIFAVTLAVALFVLPDQRRVLAVRRDRHARIRENAFERRGIVDEHVARRRAHENLDAARVTWRYALDLLEVGVRRAEIEAVVDVARCSGDAALLRQRAQVRRRWLR